MVEFPLPALPGHVDFKRLTQPQSIPASLVPSLAEAPRPCQPKVLRPGVTAIPPWAPGAVNLHRKSLTELDFPDSSVLISTVCNTRLSRSELGQVKCWKRITKSSFSNLALKTGGRHALAWRSSSAPSLPRTRRGRMRPWPFPDFVPPACCNGHGYAGRRLRKSKPASGLQDISGRRRKPSTHSSNGLIPPTGVLWMLCFASLLGSLESSCWPFAVWALKPLTPFCSMPAGCLSLWPTLILGVFWHGTG